MHIVGILHKDGMHIFGMHSKFATAILGMEVLDFIIRVFLISVEVMGMDQ